MATEATVVEIDRGARSELTEREESATRRADAAARAPCTSARARASSGGVASSYQLRDPWPIYLSRGVGAKVWDVDDNELLDFHNGFGSMVQGHAHPAIEQGGAERYPLGTHFAAPTEDAVVVGEELARRWGLPKWRYTNSGSEATMDAIRIARAADGPGHDRQDLRLLPRPPRLRDGLDRRPVRRDRRPGRLRSLPYGAGIPQTVADMTIAVPFNDAARWSGGSSA